MKDKSFLGIILVLLGVGFLLDQFNVISFNNIISTYWPIILIVIGLLGLLNKKSSKTGNLLLVVFGILFQVRNMSLIDISVFKLFWPIILIIIGINIIFSKNMLNVNSDKNSGHSNSRNSSTEDFIDQSAILAGIETNIQSQEFKGGNLTSIMGGIELDLRQAKLCNNEATLNINVVMGGVEIFIPEGWRIEHSGTPILGGVSVRKGYNLDPNSSVLKIKFSVIMGGIDIK